MKAIITPLGYPAITVDCDGDPSWSDSEIGGWGDATFSARLDEATRERLYGAEVVLVAQAPVYFGFIKRWEGESITAEGWYERCKTTAPRAVCFADDDLSPWQDRTYEAKSKVVSTQVDGTVLRCVHQQDTAGDQKLAGFYRLIPSTTASHITFKYKRGSTAHGISLWSGTYAPSADNGMEAAPWTRVWSVAGGTAGLTGEVTQAVTGTHDALMFAASAQNSYTPGVDVSTYFYDVTVYGLGWTACTPDDIVSNVESTLPAYLTPAPAEIGVDDTSPLIPASFDDGTNETVIIDRVLDYTDAFCRFEARSVNGVERPALVFKSRPTEVSYVFDAKREQADITGGDVSAMASHVRVQYTDANGTPRSVDVAASAGTLYEQWYDGAWQRSRYAVIQADTTSSARALSAGNTYLAIASREQVRGSVTVTQPVNGVSPSEIQAGRLCAIKNTARGTVTAYIRQVDHTGDNSATLTLDNTPLLDDLLAQWARKTGGRFNYVEYVDRRKTGARGQ